jgi:hypothetical protein
MERDDFVKDDFLKKILGRVPLESPSDDFTRNVMAGILTEPEPVPAKKPFYLFLKTWSLYILLGIFAVIFFLSSDIPYLTFIPGKEFFNDHIVPYFTSMFSGLARLFTGSKTLSITLSLMVAGGLLFAVDWFIRRRSEARHHAA